MTIQTSFPVKNAAGEVVATMKHKPGFILDVMHTAFENNNIKLTWDLERITACGYKIVTKARYPKPEFHYRFKSIERMIEFLVKELEKIEQHKAWVEGRKKEKQQARANMVNPYKVGQLFYDSWGYEQTNISFYEIVEVKPKSVVLRKVRQEIVPGSDSGFMCEHVRPRAGSYFGEPIKSVVQVGVGQSGPYYYINAERGSIMEYTHGEEGVYQSHYA